MKSIVLAILLSSFAFGYCVKIDCSIFIQTQKQKTSQSIRSSFEEVKSQMNEVKTKYEKQRDLLKDLNKKLQLRLALLQNSAKQDEEVLFLLKKFNQVKSIKNSIESER
nr:hypothetical protein [Campylobacter sp.]